MPNQDQAGLCALTSALSTAIPGTTKPNTPFLHLPSQVKDPEFCPEIGLWLYGNVALLMSDRSYVAASLGKASCQPSELEQLETEAENLVLGGKVIICGIHNDAHQRVAIVPLRWGSPRIVVFSGGFKYHLGENLDQEPFRAARLWRYQFDPITDLAISRRAPDKKPTFGLTNPTVDRLIVRIVETNWTMTCNSSRQHALRT